MPPDADAREPRPTRTSTEREITSYRALCTPDGRLDPDAIGWSRRPLHRCNLRGRPLRTKRWNHWAVSDGRTLFIVTLADVGYLGIASVQCRDLVTGAEFERVVGIPGALGFRHPEDVDATVAFAGAGVQIEMESRAGGTDLRVQARAGRRRLEATIAIERPPGYESMNVVIPWDAHTFQFTSKHAARPARGTVVIDGERRTFGDDPPAFACLDFGRGVWPYRTRWNWASGSSREDGRAVGINLGGLWTDGTGYTENAFWLDGRVHKIAERVVFDFDPSQPRAPWHVRAERGGRVDLRFEPAGDKLVRLRLGVVSTHLHVFFGRFSGTLVTDEGVPITLRALHGWAEDHHARW